MYLSFDVRNTHAVDFRLILATLPKPLMLKELRIYISFNQAHDEAVWNGLDRNLASACNFAMLHLGLVDWRQDGNIPPPYLDFNTIFPSLHRDHKLVVKVVNYDPQANDPYMNDTESPFSTGYHRSIAGFLHSPCGTL